MKYSTTRLVILAGVAAAAAMPALFAGTPNRASAPLEITPPAVPDGSNFSRAPFPAWRPQNDVMPPDGQAFNEGVPPNTPSTNPHPVAPPLPTLAVLQPKVSPGLMPTGLPGTSAAAPLDATRLAPAIRQTPYHSRDGLIDNLRVRERASHAALLDFRRTEPQMSAEGRTKFDELWGTVQTQRRQLKRSIQRAANASEADWPADRDQLSSDYATYGQAVAQVDAAVGLPPAP